MYKKLVERLQDFFGISRKEARGALVLMVLCFFVIWSPFIFRRWILPHFPTLSPPPDMAKLDSLALELEKENEVKSGEKKFYAKNKPENQAAPIGKPFDFDPNTISVDQLAQLGVPAFLAKRIDKFRSKGGKFRRKEDLLNIYDFPSQLYDRLKRHIVIAIPEPNNRAFSTLPPPVPERKEPVRKSTLEPFDINTADTAQLVKLRGIGSKLSLRILKFRDALGGFYAPSQYSEIFGLDSLALSELSRYAKVESQVKKLNINTISAFDLSRHSYLRDRKIVSVLINYRTQHGPFQNLDDLKKTKVIDDALIKKIEPYLSF